MRKVVWADKRGRKHAAMVRDSDPDDMAGKGVPCEPPDVDGIDWEEVKKDLHNQLVEQGLFELKDLQLKHNEVAAISMRVLKRHIVSLFKAAALGG